MTFCVKKKFKPNTSKVRAKVAQEISSLRKSANSKANRKLKNELEDLVIRYIKRDWSPEQVSATLWIKHSLSLSFVRCRESSIYLKKKISQGKKYQQAIRSLGRHLVRVIWSMIQQDRSYEIREK